MKKLLLYLVSAFPFFTFSQDFNGVWADSSNIDFTNCTAVFSTIKEAIMNDQNDVAELCCKQTCCADGCCSEGCKTGECSSSCCKDGCCDDSDNCC